MRFLRGALLATVLSTSAMAAQVTADTFVSVTKLSVDAEKYDPAALAKVANILIKAGFDEQETVSSISKLVVDRVPAEQLPDMVSASAMLSSVTGQSLARSSAKISRAFRGSVADIRKLDSEYNFLTSSQYDEIRASKLEDGRRIALRALVDRLDSATN
ncbi:hypothetical protein ACQZ5D_24020 [Agrobacterium sp. 22-211-1]